MKKFLIAIPILFSTMLVGCGIKEVDVSKYLKVDDTGVDRLGKSYACLDDSFFLDSDIFGKNPIPDNVKDSYKVEIIESPNEDLKNGDEVKLSLKYNEKLYEDNLKVKLSLSETKHKVSGLLKKYLTESDLTNSEYIKLKSETEKKAKDRMKSITPASMDFINSKFSNLEFINAYIQNPFDFNSSSEEIENPNILYVYKVDLSYDKIIQRDLSTTKPTKTENQIDTIYIFVPVKDITFDTSGNLLKYKIPNINTSEYVIPFLSSTSRNDVSIEEALKLYSSTLFGTKDHFKKINIKE